MIWPVCRCHTETMWRNGHKPSGRQVWACRVRRSAAHLVAALSPERLARKRRHELDVYHALSEAAYARRQRMKNAARRHRELEAQQHG